MITLTDFERLQQNGRVAEEFLPTEDDYFTFSFTKVEGGYEGSYDNGRFSGDYTHQDFANVASVIEDMLSVGVSQDQLQAWKEQLSVHPNWKQEGF